jgi:predicted ester cyclase
MPSDASKALVRRLYDILNAGQLDRLDELVSSDFEGPGGQRGPAAFAAPILALRAAFPDLRYTIEDIVAEGDRVAVRWTWRGTFAGAFRTFRPTGKPMTNTGFAIFQLADSKLVRTWLETDRLGFLLAIGAVPYSPAFGPPPAPVR